MMMYTSVTFERFDASFQKLTIRTKRCDNADTDKDMIPTSWPCLADNTESIEVVEAS